MHDSGSSDTPNRMVEQVAGMEYGHCSWAVGQIPVFLNTKVIQMGPKPTVQLSSSTMAEESKPQQAGLRWGGCLTLPKKKLVRNAIRGLMRCHYPSARGWLTSSLEWQSCVKKAVTARQNLASTLTLLVLAPCYRAKLGFFVGKSLRRRKDNCTVSCEASRITCNGNPITVSTHSCKTSLRMWLPERHVPVP